MTDVRTEINTVGYSTSAPETLITQVQRYLHVVELVLAGIGIIALAIAALGISNAMLAAIRERRREIGVLKAIGATDRDVRRVFLVEAGTLGLLGGVIGAAVGLAHRGGPCRRRESVPVEPGAAGRRSRISARAARAGRRRRDAARPRGGSASGRCGRRGCPPGKRSAANETPDRAQPWAAMLLVARAQCLCGRRTIRPRAPQLATTRKPTTLVTIGGSATEGDGVQDRFRAAWPYLLFDEALPDLDEPRERRARRRDRRERSRDQQVPVAREVKPEVVAIWLGVDDLAQHTPIDQFTSELRR